jgi:hypothetical protein
MRDARSEVMASATLLLYDLNPNQARRQKMNAISAYSAAIKAHDKIMQGSGVSRCGLSAQSMPRTSGGIAGDQLINGKCV